MRWLLHTGAAALLLACSTPPEGITALNPGARVPAPETNMDGFSPEDRRALFGDTHLHTSYSFDAYGFSTSRTDPDMAYRFAQGELIDYLGMKVQRHDPLDFLAVTDHAEFMGALNQLDDPNSYLSLSEFGRIYREQIAVVTDRRD